MWRATAAYLRLVFAQLDARSYPPRMNAIHRIIRQPLSLFVEYLWLSEDYLQPHAAERILPTGCMSLVMNVDNSATHIGAVVSGARTHSFVLDTSRPLSVIGAVFKPGGGFPFFVIPAGELENQSVSLGSLWGGQSHYLHEQILEARDVATKFKLLELALLARFSSSTIRDPAVTYAVRAFQASGTVATVGAIVEHTGLTARRFISTFRDQVGLAPKAFSRVARFRRVISSIGASPHVDWADIALRCGYFDQAHFNHDFREFAGVSPTEYIRRRTASPNHVRLLA
jgi:AraC-like DNA-binding protein